MVELAVRSPLAAFSFDAARGRGVTAAERPLTLARMIVRKGCRAALANALQVRLGLQLPNGPQRTEAGRIALLGVGVDAWLAAGEAGLTDSLRHAAGEYAAVCDQTGGYAVLQVSGEKVREALAKMIPIDLHARTFPPGAVASTSAAHMAITLWHLQDGPGADAVFEIAIPRSLAVSFAHLLADSAAEFGFTFTPPG
jgi:heterotetrameric sarcosine oxidase gamma subunit